MSDAYYYSGQFDEEQSMGIVEEMNKELERLRAENERKSQLLSDAESWLCGLLAQKKAAFAGYEHRGDIPQLTTLLESIEQALSQEAP